MWNLSRLLNPTGALPLALFALLFASAAIADPSGRVAYLSDIQGAVSYSPSGEDQWIGVVRNRPLIRGDRLWSDRNSRVEFQVGSSAVRLGPNTSVELLDLDDRIAQLQLTQGSVNVRVRRLYRGQTIEIATPMLAFSINRRGQYRIDVDPYDGQTTVTVWQGAGTAYGENASFRVRSGDAVAFYDVYLSDYEIYGVADDDDFDRYAHGRNQYLDQSVSLNYVGDDVIGYAELDRYGNWGSDQNYGNIWYPRDVARDWAPYRDGHWVWQEPWGWTWVDNAPWGFAPSHYGRWVSLNHRWAWVPGPRRVRPIYAPALVAFVGGSGWSLSLSLGGGSSAIGWFPLGPREVYVPSYQASRDYFTRVNVNNTVINNTTINNVYNNYSSGDINVNQANYVNSNVESAVTAVPTSVFVNAQPVRQAALQYDNKAVKGREFTRIAPIAPSERSVIGAGKVAKDQPKREIFDRRVVAHNAPPPAEASFSKREKQLQKHPGRALEPTAAGTVQDRNTKPVANVLVVSDQKEVIDRRATVDEVKQDKPERLDRSDVAKHKAGRVRSVKELPRAEQQADGDKKAAQQQQREADTDKQAAQQKQRKADSDKQAAEQQQREAETDQQAAQQKQRKADSDKQAAQQQQREAETDKQAAQQKQRKADSDKQAAEQQQRDADTDKQKQAAQQQQRKADNDKKAAQQQQREAETDKQAAQQKQRKADSDKQAAEQQQRQADNDKKAAQQQQRQAESDKQAAQQKQRKADSDKQAAEQQQRQADNDKKAAQQQRKAESDKQAAEQQQRKADSDKQAAQQQQRQADADKQAAQQQQRQADADKQAAQQKQRQADSDKQAAQQQQRQADADKQAAQQQRQADNDKKAAQQQQRQADADKQAVQQQQRQADADKQAAQQQRQADNDKKAAQQQQRQADADKQAAQQKQRQADIDKQAAQQQQRQADNDKQAAQQQQRQADNDKQAAQQQQRQADSDKQAAQQQRSEPKQDNTDGNNRSSKSKAQAACERQARKDKQDASICEDVG